MKGPPPGDFDWRVRVFDSLSFPSLVLDRQRTIVSVNRKFLETIGAAEEEIVGRTCRSVFYEFFYDSQLPCSQEKCPLDQTMHDGRGHSLLRRVRKGDGTMRWEDRVFFPILDDEGRTLYVIESVRDVTRTKKLEQKVAQSEKMASLGRLAAGVAHEINNPLTGILLYGNMMLERIGEDPDLRAHLDCILEDAGRCRDIVQHLLAYSRQAGSSRERFSLNRLVEESLRLIRDQRLFLHIVIERQFSPTALPVHADHNQMQQVVINLVMNAIDAMEKRGTLTLKTFRAEEKGCAVLEVSDTGCGIDEEDRSRVFDPFFTTKETGRGTGLGLSTAYGIVKDNGGDISIRRSGPEGTTFCVSLPLAGRDETHIPESIG